MFIYFLDLPINVDIDERSDKESDASGQDVQEVSNDQKLDLKLEPGGNGLEY